MHIRRGILWCCPQYGQGYWYATPYPLNPLPKHRGVTRTRVVPYPKIGCSDVAISPRQVAGKRDEEFNEVVGVTCYLIRPLHPLHSAIARNVLVGNSLRR
ncbi:hypothetical protein PAXRUDRAFT_502479 [Paxillus rubicundulus Ve08.2h10]|uniref:Uncharacterized protein n=1 Tax=Paxillus rubicundulus Ve08.2h10 TaxID=930991 RepID=A0A0D0D562_9AGAM|nr:hypothetical protein PAXRUDRAFT_502479 [Paxillus rubicundulus Ve08.2h10]